MNHLESQVISDYHGQIRAPIFFNDISVLPKIKYSASLTVTRLLVNLCELENYSTTNSKYYCISPKHGYRSFDMVTSLFHQLTQFWLNSLLLTKEDVMLLVLFVCLSLGQQD